MVDIIAKIKKDINEEFDFLEKYYFEHPEIKDMLIELHIKVENAIDQLEEECEEDDSSSTLQ
jgi:hypothetical protein